MSDLTVNNPTVILCKYCLRVIIEAECSFCKEHLVGEHRTTTITKTNTPKPAEVMSLAQLRPVVNFRLKSNKAIIGRDPDCDVQLGEDFYVSRHHAQITFEAGKYFVEDLGSKNGTKLNGSQIIAREPLKPGDIITIGQTHFVVQ